MTKFHEAFQFTVVVLVCSSVDYYVVRYAKNTLEALDLLVQTFLKSYWIRSDQREDGAIDIARSRVRRRLLACWIPLQAPDAKMLTLNQLW